MVQESLRKQSGVTVIVYEQTCAAEKRRRRKINTFPDPDQRIFINALVCEGCGDCSVQSNCIAIQPLETELGRKRKIDQSACNKDFSCTKGFCPSFVTVTGGKPRHSASIDLAAGPPIPDTMVPPIGDGFDMVIAGIGGTGVVTVSAILGMAARIEGLGVSLYDMTGLSQKGGQVFSHVRLRSDPEGVIAARVGPAAAHVILACDLIAAVQPEVLDTIASGKTQIFGNADTVATADFQTHRDLSVPSQLLTSRLASAAGCEPALLSAATLSQQLLGDSIGTNLLMLGFAWQRGALPLKLESIERAIALNGKAVEPNLKAFAVGRLAATRKPSDTTKPPSLQDFISDRTADLAVYWNEAYAQRYAELTRTVLVAAAPLDGGEALAWAVARSAYKLMAYKDEYEVARLYADGRFREALAKEFADVRSLRIHLAPPFLASIDKRTGRSRKWAFGGWVMALFRILYALRRVREGPLDLFARTAERRLERDLRDAYVARITQLARTLSIECLPAAIEIAAAPLEVRGFGHVKADAAQALLTRLRACNGLG
jgi:indolepyruvate ferredoxin oxidoreductase